MMSSQVPIRPKIYHILHVDRLRSILKDGYLYSDSIVQQRNPVGTIIGMSKIKKRRLEELVVGCYPDLHVGNCVPFYFCPRSVMLYILHSSNHSELDYHDGQEPIVHLEADLYRVVDWAVASGKRWSFTSTNAGSYYADFYNSTGVLNRINWSAINSDYWMDCREEKQAEFLVEDEFPVHLIERIGVYSRKIYDQVISDIKEASVISKVEIKRRWYY